MKNFVSLVAVVVAVLFANEAVAAEKPSPVKASAPAGSQKAIGDWLLSCVPTVGDHNSCMLTQTLASKSLRKTVSVFTVGRNASGKLVGSIRVPVGVALPAGLKVGIENSAPVAVPYSACHRIGCFAPFDLTGQMLGEMRKATKVSVVAQTVSQQNLSMKFSMRGFPAAYDAYVKSSR